MVETQTEVIQERRRVRVCLLKEMNVRLGRYVEARLEDDDVRVVDGLVGKLWWREMDWCQRQRRLLTRRNGRRRQRRAECAASGEQ